MRHNRVNNVFEPQEPSEENDDQVPNGSVGVDLTSDEYANVPQWETERTTALDRNTNMKARLDALKSDLNASRVDKSETLEDRQYQLLMATGQSKYKTLTQIRAGTTRRRIDQFENM